MHSLIKARESNFWATWATSNGTYKIEPLNLNQVGDCCSGKLYSFTNFQILAIVRVFLFKTFWYVSCHSF